MMANGVTLPFTGPSVYIPAGDGKAKQGGRGPRLEMQKFQGGIRRRSNSSALVMVLDPFF